MSYAQLSNWTKLPSIFIVDILSRLPHKDRLNASVTCKRWRACFYHPSLWQSAVFKVKYGCRNKTRYLAGVCAKFVRDVKIELDVNCISNVKEFLRILTLLQENRNLETLSFHPSKTHIVLPENNISGRDDDVMEPNLCLLTVIQSSRRLRHLSLGCLAQFTDYSDTIVGRLSRFHGDSLESLHIESVKEEPQYYEIANLPCNYFDCFTNLKELGLDYDNLSNQLLLSLSSTTSTLNKLVVNIHGVDPNKTIFNASWDRLTQTNPDVLLTLNLLHSTDGSHALLDILTSSMPLAHFRQYFCQHLNSGAITYIAGCHSSTLKSFCVVDGMTDFKPNHHNYETEENPFVMLAWKCSELQSFTLIGYEMTTDDLIAIARLRGAGLRSLRVAHCCIGVVEEDEESLESWITFGITAEDFDEEISGSLNCGWAPLRDLDLHPAVVMNTEAETAYLSQLLSDQAVTV